jgi:hypothetical protein
VVHERDRRPDTVIIKKDRRPKVIEKKTIVHDHD